MVNDEPGSAEFIERVCRQGLSDIILNAPGSIRGRIGHTTLSCGISKQGPVYLEFKCLAEDFPTGEPNHPWESGENWSAFVVIADGGGTEVLHQAGCATRGDLPSRMIRDVTENWPKDPDAQRAIFHSI